MSKIDLEIYDVVMSKSDHDIVLVSEESVDKEYYDKYHGLNWMACTKFYDYHFELKNWNYNSRLTWEECDKLYNAKEWCLNNVNLIKHFMITYAIFCENLHEDFQLNIERAEFYEYYIQPDLQYKLNLLIGKATKKYIKYEDYIISDKWQEKRLIALDRAGNKCQLCSNLINLNVHHNTYDRLGDELETDLVVLCRDCHAKYHGK